MNSPGGAGSLFSLFLSFPLSACVFSGFFVWQWREAGITSHLGYPSHFFPPLLPPLSFHTLKQIRALLHYPHPHLKGLEADKKTHFFPLSRFHTITFLKSHFAAVYPPHTPQPPSPLAQIKKEEEEENSFLPPPVVEVAQSRRLIVT